MGRRNREEEVEEKILSPEEQAAAFLDERSGDHLNFVEEVDYRISTGSLNLDVVLDGGYCPGFHRLCGHNNAGKTPHSLEVQSNFLAFHKKNNQPARGILVRAEGRFSKENARRTGVEYVTDPKEWRDGNVLVLNCNKYEVIAEFIGSLIRVNPTGTLYCFIIDSMDGLKVKADDGKNLDQNAKVAGAPLLSKRFLSDLSLDVNVRGHLGLLISQVSADIKIDPYAKTPPKDGNFSGGNALSHYANWTLEFNKYYQGDLILDPPSGKPNDGKTKILGHVCKVSICKSTNEKNYTRVEYPIRHGVEGKSAIWREYEIVDQLIAGGYLSKAGAWLKVAPSLRQELAENKLDLPEQFNGTEKARIFFGENPAIMDYLYNKFKVILSALQQNKTPETQ